MILSSVSLTNAANVESVALIGSDSLDVIGHGDAETLVGNGGADSLVGGGDTLVGGEGNDSLDGQGGLDTADYGATTSAIVVDLGAGTATGAEIGNDQLASIEEVVGGSAGDVLIGIGSTVVLDGRGGDDSLVANAGVNSLIGGTGDDTFVIGAAVGSIVEVVGGGTNRILSSLTITNVANVESLTLTGNGAIDATGTDAGETLVGNDGGNTLTGNVGDDSLIGAAGDDVLIGAPATTRSTVVPMRTRSTCPGPANRSSWTWGPAVRRARRLEPIP